MKTSIHYKPVQSHAEKHNLRATNLDYIFKDLTYLNINFSEISVADKLIEIEDYCKKTSGRKLQKNAQPIKEAVVVIKENTTELDIQNLIKKLREELDIETFQYSVHRDEGYISKVNNEFVTNHHAHLISSFQDKNTGKMLRLNQLDYCKMQEICADVLGMERGEKSSKVHLTATQFKIKIHEEKLQELSREIEVDGGAFKKYQLLQQKLVPQFEAYKEKRNSFKSWFDYEIFLNDNKHKIGSFYWFDFVIYANLVEDELYEFLRYMNLDKEKIEFIINNSTKMRENKFAPEVDAIRKEIVFNSQDIDFHNLSKKVNELRYKMYR